MNKKEILENIASKSDGEIYLGVVGTVRTGKSTFIKKVIENLVIPNISDEFERNRCLDEIPQSASGKMIMTTEPKFVPTNFANIKIDDFSCKMKLVDCVGFVIPNAVGYKDNDGNLRMIKTPWFDEAIPFDEAALIGTEKVIHDHATIGIVVTTDGSFGELKRSDYLEGEEKVINELKEIGKPFIVILNSKEPESTNCLNIKKELIEKYQVPVLNINVESLNEREILDILKEALYEFKVNSFDIKLPSWLFVLDKDNMYKKSIMDNIKDSTMKVLKVRDVDGITSSLNNPYIKNTTISNLDTKNALVEIKINIKDEVYDDVLKSYVGDSLNNKTKMLEIFKNYKESHEYLKNVKNALSMALKTGYGVIYPNIKDMKLTTPQVIKQGNRFGIKLKAEANSLHILNVPVESTFEPIIGSEEQSKELINYLMKDYKDNPDNIWKSEIFGRSLEEIVREGISSKLGSVSDSTRFKIGQTMTKIVNKGSNNLIAFVI